MDTPKTASLDEEKKLPYNDVAFPEASTDEAPVMRRHLKSRHIAFIGLGGGIGVGLFVGVGRGLSNAGPLGIFLAFVIMGAIMWGVVSSHCDHRPIGVG
jgi:amino acid permease